MPNPDSEDRLMDLLFEIVIDFIGKSLYDPLVFSTYSIITFLFNAFI